MDAAKPKHILLHPSVNVVVAAGESAGIRDVADASGGIAGGTDEPETFAKRSFSAVELSMFF